MQMKASVCFAYKLNTELADLCKEIAVQQTAYGRQNLQRSATCGTTRWSKDFVEAKVQMLLHGRFQVVSKPAAVVVVDKPIVKYSERLVRPQPATKASLKHLKSNAPRLDCNRPAIIPQQLLHWLL